MAVYMIGYDLNKSGQDYDSLIEALKTYEDWWHHLDSTWIIVTAKTATEIGNHLAQYMDSNDELLVAKLSGDTIWAGFSGKGSAWLSQYF